MKRGIICQACGIEAPARHVEFHQNVGALVMRFHRQIRGNLCKSCIHANFWKMTAINATVGWLGMISLLLAPIFIINNIVRYISVLGMPSVPPGASAPTLTTEDIVRLEPVTPELIQRLNRSEDMLTVCEDLSKRARVTPGQVLIYIIALSKRATAQPPTHGFPVQPVMVEPMQQ